MPLTHVMGHAYSSYIYKEDLTKIFSEHDTSSPLFVYLSLHNVHGPFQAPEEWLNIYLQNSICKKRRTYQAMVSVADKCYWAYCRITTK